MKSSYRLWGLAFLFSVMAAANAAPPPISAFARLEEVNSVRVSPDGRYLAFITQSKGKQMAMTLDLATTGSSPKLVLADDKDGHFDMTSCRWAKNTRLLCSYIAPVQERGFVYRISKLVAVNADGSDIKVLVQDSTVASGAQVFDNLRDNKDSVLIEAPENNSQIFGLVYSATRPTNAVWELNIYTGQLKRILPGRPSIDSYYSDGHGNVRLGVGTVDKARVYFARRKDDSEWRQLAKVEPFAPLLALVPIAVVPETNKAYALGPNGDRRALWLIDLDDKEKPQLLFDNPVADIDTPIIGDGGNLLGVTYETDRPFVYYTDSKLGAVMDSVKKVLPDTLNSVVSRSHDGKKLVIRAESDRDAGTFYLFDTATAQMTRVGTRYPELDSAQLPRMQTVEYPARDGTKIPGYLTTPIGERAEKLPLIVLPHGGPIDRDSWRFDFLRMFLASRGYAVLQMNYRGSSGYGFNWQIAAHQDWGGLTYDDIVDGTRWAIAQGIADPKRICIVGWSFGGYAALVGAQRNPDLYRCSASIAGVSDLVELRGRFKGGSVAWEQIGVDTDKLKTNSPIRHAAEVKIPVLMIQGTLDAQVPYEQSENMAGALKKAGKQYKFVTIKNGDHSLWRESERTTLLTELEQFLRTNLGPGTLASTH